MSSYNKAKGTKFEVDLEDYLNEALMKARRLPRAGAKDIGDVALILKALTIVIEAKNVKKQDMSEWLRQADVESCNYELKYGVPTIPVVATKTRQKGIGEARVTMNLDTLLELVRMLGES